MTDKRLPFTLSQLETIAAQVGTPFHLYDEAAMRANAQAFYRAFAWVPGGFKNFFAVKALPNPYILDLVRQVGMGGDCSSLAELRLCEAAGIRGENIIFTSNDTPAKEFQKAYELGALINLDDISHIDFLNETTGMPDLVCFRYNPGALKGGNIIIGNPEDSKYGFTREQLFEGYKKLKSLGVKRFGLHTMVASNELDPDYFIETAEIVFDLIVDLHKELGIRFEFANLGGGIGIPYRSEHKPVNMKKVSKGIKERYESMIIANGLAPLRIYFESGRAITGPFGFLVSKVLHLKETYKKYVGLDASMANLMRPALYGAYHHITVLGKEDQPHTNLYDVTGSLCENNDKFAINRLLPEIKRGDIVVIHDTGAHGHSMGFNYNGKTRSAELLLRENGEVVQIRRRETIDDYFATLDFDGLKKFDV